MSRITEARIERISYECPTDGRSYFVEHDKLKFAIEDRSTNYGAGYLGIANGGRLSVTARKSPCGHAHSFDLGVA